MIQVGKYRWDITDEYGWDIDKCASRDIKISDILSEKNQNKFLCKLSLHRPGDMYICIAWFSEYDKKISFNSHNSNDISIKFRCASLIEANKFVDLVCDGNNLVVMPKNS